MATKVIADIAKVKRTELIKVEFGYDPAFVAAVKSINGRRFVPKDKGGPFWTVPLTMTACHALREEFGQALSIGEDLKAWAWREVRRTQELTGLAGADDAELRNVPEAATSLAEALHPYQRAGTAFLAHGGLCADEPGLGKTLEAIAAVHEAEAQDGPVLVIAPLSSLEVVWGEELGRWQHEPVYVLPETKRGREETLEAFRTEVVEPGFSGWLVVHPAFLRPSWFKCLEHEDDWDDKDVERGWHRHPVPVPLIHDVEWNAVIIDECHKEGLRNPKSITAVSMNKLKAGLRIALSGTPMAGKPVQLWGILHWLRPDQFRSKWAWINEWLHTTHNGYGRVFCDGTDEDTGRPCGVCDKGILRDRREAFDKALTPYVLRRTKAEVYKELPPKAYVDRWLPLSGTQERIYREMEADAYARLSEAETVTANGVLAEYTRLKQFASAAWKVGDDGALEPTGESNKLDYVLDLLRERGITGDEEEEGDSQVVIFSQFTEMVEMVERELNTRGIETLTITGKVKGKARAAAQREFQSDGGPRVLVMNLHAGGVAITLDRADTVVMLDEWWAPDVMTQAEDRVHRVSRIHQVTVYYLRSRDTIEERIMDMVDDKGSLDKRIMDDRRKLLGLLKSA